MTRLLSRHRIETSVLLTAFGLGSLLSLTTSCSSPASAALPEREPAPLEVSTIVAEAHAVPHTVALTGTLVAARAAEVAADGAGRVVATFADRGDLVEAGAPLARLDSRSAALARAEAGASAAALLAQQANADLECARAGRLFAGNAISRAEFDRISTSCATSTHSVDAARAREGMASKALSDALVRAPFRGIVAERRVEVGDYVAAGRSVMALVDTSSLKLEVAVPETAIPSVAEGKTVSFSVAAYPGREFSGKISRESPSLRPKSRDQIVEVAVDNADGALRPGMFASARLVVREDRWPLVPGSAVSGVAPTERLFVVSRESRVEERIVATGERLGDRVAITKGIAAGDTIVSQVTPALRDGVRVK
jgi:membrane fusion protein (multidrug efflux system)